MRGQHGHDGLAKREPGAIGGDVVDGAVTETDTDHLGEVLAVIDLVPGERLTMVGCRFDLQHALPRRVKRGELWRQLHLGQLRPRRGEAVGERAHVRGDLRRSALE